MKIKLPLAILFESPTADGTKHRVVIGNSVTFEVLTMDAMGADAWVASEVQPGNQGSVRAALLEALRSATHIDADALAGAALSKLLDTMSEVEMFKREPDDALCDALQDTLADAIRDAFDGSGE